MPQPVNRTVLGIAKEAVKGTAVAPTDFIAVKSVTPFDKIDYLDDTGWRGSMVDVYDEIAGPASSTFDFNGDVFPDTFGYALAGLLGDVVTTGAGAPFTHTMAVKNSGDGQPTSYTLTDFDVIEGRAFPGCQFTDLDLKFSSAGLLEYSAKTVGFPSASAAGPTSSWSAVKPMANWIGAPTIGGSSILSLTDGNITLKRAGAPIHNIDGTQAPYKVWVGELSVSGKLTFVMEDNTELTRYLTNTQPALVLPFQQGAGATQTKVQLTCSKAAYTVANVQRGKDYIELAVNFQAIANTTDVGASGGFSPVKAVLLNAKPANTYV